MPRASASRVPTPTSSDPRACASARAVAMPIRRPVNEPGPTPTAIRSTASQPPASARRARPRPAAPSRAGGRPFAERRLAQHSAAARCRRPRRRWRCQAPNMAWIGRAHRQRCPHAVAESGASGTSKRDSKGRLGRNASTCLAETPRAPGIAVLAIAGGGTGCAGCGNDAEDDVNDAVNEAQKKLRRLQSRSRSTTRRTKPSTRPRRATRRPPTRRAGGRRRGTDKAEEGDRQGDQEPRTTTAKTDVNRTELRRRRGLRDLRGRRFDFADDRPRARRRPRGGSRSEDAARGSTAGSSPPTSGHSTNAIASGVR